MVTQRIDDITSAEPAVRDPIVRRACAPVESLTIHAGRFRYRDDCQWALDGIDLRIEPGKRVALVGPSGSGKSTIARLLVRFFDLDEGHVRVNGHDSREYAQEDIRREVTLGALDAHVFATTISTRHRPRPSWTRLCRPRSSADCS